MLGRTKPIPPDWLQPSGERRGILIAGIVHNRKQFVESGIVYNRGVIPNLSADLAVEVPIVVDAAGVHPISLGPLPEPIAKLLSNRRVFSNCRSRPRRGAQRSSRWKPC